MFILTIEDHPEGVFSVFDDEERRVVPIWTKNDDAQRYLMMIQEEEYPPMQVVEMEDHVIIDACQQRGQPFTVITPDDLLIPPDNLV